MSRSIPASILALVLLLLHAPAFAQGGKAPDKDEFIEVSEEPRPIRDIQELVSYPDNARRTGVEGKVIVSALIDETGKVIKCEVEKSDHPWLEEAAVAAMKKARFSPAMQGTKPVKVWYTQSIMFKLNPSNYSETQPSIGTDQAVGEVRGPLPSAPPATGTKAAILIGKAPALPIKVSGAQSIALELTIGMYGDVLSVKTMDPALKASLTPQAEKIVKALKFLPGEINDEPRMTRTQINFRLQ